MIRLVLLMFGLFLSGCMFNDNDTSKSHIDLANCYMNGDLLVCKDKPISEQNSQKTENKTDQPTIKITLE